MRLFVAIDLNEEMVSKIKSIEDMISKEDVDVKFVEPSNIHITLKFLGEVDNESLEGINDNIKDSIRDIKPFKIVIEGMNYFGNPSYIRTIWIDVKEGKENLIKIIEELNEKLDHIRHEHYKPDAHLTIGRVRSGKNKDILLHKIEEFNDVNIGEVYVNEIKLKESLLTKKGPVYNDVAVFKLE